MCSQMKEVPVRVQVQPCRLIEVMGAVAHALDSGEYALADDQNQIVVKYLPARLLVSWADVYQRMRRREPVDYARMPFATLLTHKPTPVLARRRAVEILMNSGVPLNAVLHESANAKLFGPNPRRP